MTGKGIRSQRQEEQVEIGLTVFIVEILKDAQLITGSRLCGRGDIVESCTFVSMW